MEEQKLPWQITASKLIGLAKEFYKPDDDFSRQVAYLLLDVGVETTFRIFLSLSNRKTKKVGFKRREAAAKGTVEKDELLQQKTTISAFDELSFHNLVEGVMQVAESDVNEKDLEKVEHFHGIRNKIYHLGDGVVPTQNNFKEYLNIAEILLLTLLGEPNSDDISKSPEAAGITKDIDDLDYSSWEWCKKDGYVNLCYDIAIATAQHRPRYVLRSFEKEVEIILLSNNVHEVPHHSNRPYYQNQHIIEDFSKLMGKEIDDIEFIEEVFQDITYLRLAALLSQIKGDYDDLDNYVEFRNYAKAGTINFDKLTADEIKRVEELWLWREKISEQINNWMRSKISTN